jgi:hypothetical protein
MFGGGEPGLFASFFARTSGARHVYSASQPSVVRALRIALFARS